MIDTHTHLDFKDFDEDREEVISRAFDNGVKKIVNIGVDLEASKKSIALAEKHENIFASVGMHPEFFSKGNWGDPPHRRASWGDDLKKMAEHEKVVAIGETGLDYFRIGEIRESREIRERQKEGFLDQIELARELNLPVIVHCRDAWEDIFEIISDISKSSAFPALSKVRPFPFPTSREIPQGQTLTKFVLHCYSGEKKDTEKFLKLPNIYFSFSGNITYPKPIERAEKLAEAVRVVPLDRIMLDSDSPFLAPQAVRGKRNEPAFVKYIAKKIAEIKEISGEEVERATDENAERFFELGRSGKL